MTINELQVQLDISLGNETEVLKQHASKTSYGYLFIDSNDGQCYLFNKHGHLDDIRKVKCIQDYVFVGCTSLESIIIPDSVKSIGDNVFEDCISLESITIPDSVKSIGNSAFWNCTSLKSIIIPNSVESIGKLAFAYCTSLRSITIPDSVENIGKEAFYNYTFLKEVIFKGKTIDQVNAMDDYPWSIEDTSIIKCR